MSDQVLSQDEIDRVFQNLNGGPSAADQAKKAAAYDFRRPDRVAKDQLRSIHSLHDNFARSLASSLSGYLRTFVATNLISVEQLSFSEVVRNTIAPTCVVALRMQPTQGTSLLEMSNSLVFPMIEMLLGGTGKASKQVERDTTEIERSILDGVLRLICRDLKVAWQSIADMEFEVEGYQVVPQLFQFLPPNEAMLGISMEVKVGEHSGLINLSIPSIIIKMMRQKVNQNVTMRRVQTGEVEQSRMLQLIRNARVTSEVWLSGTKMLLSDLIKIDEGDIIALDHPLSKTIDLRLNDTVKFKGHIVSSGSKRAFQVAKYSEEEV